MSIFSEATKKMVAREDVAKSAIAELKADYHTAAKSVVSDMLADIRTMVKEWSEDDIVNWMDLAMSDDSVSARLFNLVMDAWCLEHPDNSKIQLPKCGCNPSVIVIEL